MLFLTTFLICTFACMNTFDTLWMLQWGLIIYVIGFLHSMPWYRTSVLINVTLDLSKKGGIVTNISKIVMDKVKTIQCFTTEFMLYEFHAPDNKDVCHSMELTMPFQGQFNF